MSLDLRITQGRTAFLDLAIQAARLDQDVREAVRDMAATYRGRVIAELRAPKGGRRYGERTGRSFYRRQRRSVEMFGGKRGTYSAVVRSTKKTRAYTASAPGQAPATYTGVLARAVRSKIPARGKGWSARVFADKGTAFYRHFLEFGHGPGRKGKGHTGFAAPRPIWGKYQREIEAELPRRIVTALERFQRGS
ncbi:MAG: hypothetical protein KAX84_03870 [Burkholderiales bacterium]|nr:hypothetical protein [Burkholderiales bacterium]